MIAKSNSSLNLSLNKSRLKSLSHAQLKPLVTHISYVMAVVQMGLLESVTNVQSALTSIFVKIVNLYQVTIIPS